MVLKHVSYEFLKKVAVYGAVLSVSGCSVLYYMLQRNIAASGYYTKAISELKCHNLAMNILGAPLRVQTLKLNDKRNKIDNQKAQVLIPVSGRQTSGFLYSEATHNNGQWELQYVLLEFKGRKEKLVILDKRTRLLSSTVT